MNSVFQSCRLPRTMGYIWIVLSVAGCDHVDQTSLRVDPGIRSLQPQSLREVQISTVVDDVARDWGFEAYPPGQTYSGSDAPSIIRWYVVGYPDNSNHIYLTLKRPERPGSQVFEVRLEELFAWSESGRKAMIRRDLVGRLGERFGPGAVRQER